MKWVVLIAAFLFDVGCTFSNSAQIECDETCGGVSAPDHYVFEVAIPRAKRFCFCQVPESDQWIIRERKSK